MGKYKSCSSHHQPDRIVTGFSNGIIHVQPSNGANICWLPACRRSSSRVISSMATHAKTKSETKINASLVVWLWFMVDISGFICFLYQLCEGRYSCNTLWGVDRTNYSFTLSLSIYIYIHIWLNYGSAHNCWDTCAWVLWFLVDIQ